MQQQIVIEKLIEAWNEFNKVDTRKLHPDDVNDFRKGIHDLQRIIYTSIHLHPEDEDYISEIKEKIKNAPEDFKEKKCMHCSGGSFCPHKDLTHSIDAMILNHLSDAILLGKDIPVTNKVSHTEITPKNTRKNYIELLKVIGYITLNAIVLWVMYLLIKG